MRDVLLETIHEKYTILERMQYYKAFYDWVFKSIYRHVIEEWEQSRSP